MEERMRVENFGLYNNANVIEPEFANWCLK